jgi:hypothetical protein
MVTTGLLPLIMVKLDELVLAQLADKVFAPERLQVMMTELRKNIKASKNGQQDRIKELNRQLKQIEKRQENLLNAIEEGAIERDETTQRRAQQLKTAREALFIALAGVRAILPCLQWNTSRKVRWMYSARCSGRNYWLRVRPWQRAI